MLKRIIIILVVVFATNIQAQEEKRLKTKFTDFLADSYYSINFGGIFYPFSNANLPPGYSTETFSRNWFSGRMLIGHKFTDTWAIQFGTMRPAAWFKYDNINNIGYDRSVWINAWTLSLKKDFKLNDKWSIYGEAGFANVTRVGFDVEGTQVYNDAHFGSILYGFGAQYWLSNKWRLSANGTFIPENQTNNQPSISQASLGFEYHLQQVDDTTAEEYANNEYFFPNHIFQVSYGNGDVGFSMNRFFSMNMKIGNFESFGLPVFWLGDVKAQHAFSLTYQGLIYRSEKIFSLDWGASATYFQSEFGTDVFAFSIFPVLRFYLMRRKAYDFYLNYSIIGPAFISKSDIDGFDSGPKITYQDTMGFGLFLGKERKYNFEVRIMHYSNGNIFTRNAGVAVPIQFTFGRTF